MEKSSPYKQILQKSQIIQSFAVRIQCEKMLSGETSPDSRSFFNFLTNISITSCPEAWESEYSVTIPFSGETRLTERRKSTNCLISHHVTLCKHALRQVRCQNIWSKCALRRHFSWERKFHKLSDAAPWWHQSCLLLSARRSLLSLDLSRKLVQKMPVTARSAACSWLLHVRC